MSFMFVSQILPVEMENELKKHGVSCIRLNPSNNLSSELKYHPDMITFKDTNNRWIFEKQYDLNYSDISKSFIDLSLNDGYPNDCIFNNVFVENKLICGKKTNVSYLSDDHEIIRINQGYVKCSVITVTDNAFITSDISVQRMLQSLDKDVLFVDNKCIGLNGFDCGFIGGCAGKISDRIIAFTGNLKKHKQGKNILSFCRNYNNDCISLSADDLYDYGGLLSID